MKLYVTEIKIANKWVPVDIALKLERAYANSDFYKLTDPPSTVRIRVYASTKKIYTA